MHYYRVPLDARSLDYGVFFEHGEQRSRRRRVLEPQHDAGWASTEVAELLLSLPEFGWFAVDVVRVLVLGASGCWGTRLPAA